MTDPVSGIPRGYGFVRFSDEIDQQPALTEMQGLTVVIVPYIFPLPLLRTRVLLVVLSCPEHLARWYVLYGSSPMGCYGARQPMNQYTDPKSTTVFVGRLF